MADDATTRRELLTYAGTTGVGVSATAGLAAHLHRNRADTGPRADVTAVLLTWQRDPTTTMTIDWHTIAALEDQPTIEYAPDGTDAWETAIGTSRPFPFSPRTVHRIELTGLTPGTTYAFRLPGLEEPYRFRTAPASVSPEEPLTFATGGDTMHSWKFLARMNDVVAAADVEFVQWGGDLAYADGLSYNVAAWYDWFAVNTRTLVTDEKRLIPVVPAIGNHEVRGGYYYEHEDYEQTDSFRRAMAPYVYELLAFPGQPGYGALDFGEYLSLLALDSNHTNPVGGEQADWLESSLADREGIDHVIPSYHVPAYPANRSPYGPDERAVRETWTPLFDDYAVDIALEHHDHVYKRTVPIRDGTPDPDGTVYAGDGAWGVETRSADQRNQWYIDQFDRHRHGKLVTIDGDRVAVDVLGGDGRSIDSFEV